MTAGGRDDPGSHHSWRENGRMHFSQQRWADPRHAERVTGHLHTATSRLEALGQPLGAWNQGCSGRYEVALLRLINPPCRASGQWTAQLSAKAWDVQCVEQPASEQTENRGLNHQVASQVLMESSYTNYGPEYSIASSGSDRVECIYSGFFGAKPIIVFG